MLSQRRRTSSVTPVAGTWAEDRLEAGHIGESCSHRHRGWGQKQVQTNSRHDRNTAHGESPSQADPEQLQTERPRLLVSPSLGTASQQVGGRRGPWEPVRPEVGRRVQYAVMRYCGQKIHA